VAGRKLSNTVDYFPHFAKSGKTLFILKSQYGNNGYAFWFQLLEILCQEEGRFYNCKDESAWQYLLSRTGVNEETGTKILNLLAKLGNIDPELWCEKKIWCNNLVTNLAEVYKKRGRAVPDKPSLNHEQPVTELLIPVTELPISAPEITQSKVEYSKGKDNNTCQGSQTASTPDPLYENRKKIFEGLKARRGYNSPKPGAEAAAITWMLKQGHAVEQVLYAYDKMVKDPFWDNKFLSMQSVKSQIGEILKKGEGYGKAGGHVEEDGFGGFKHGMFKPDNIE
jgi:hypothetical protein